MHLQLIQGKPFSTHRMVVPKKKVTGVFTSCRNISFKLIAGSKELLLQSEITSKCCQVLTESVTILRFQVPVDICHQLIEAL
jgi:hypothetical protein